MSTTEGDTSLLRVRDAGDSGAVLLFSCGESRMGMSAVSVVAALSLSTLAPWIVPSSGLILSFLGVPITGFFPLRGGEDREGCTEAFFFGELPFFDFMGGSLFPGFLDQGVDGDVPSPSFRTVPALVPATILFYENRAATQQRYLKVPCTSCGQRQPFIVYYNVRRTPSSEQRKAADTGKMFILIH